MSYIHSKAGYLVVSSKHLISLSMCVSPLAKFRVPKFRSVVHLTDTDDESLEEFLRFLYTDECKLTGDNVVSVMYLAKKYIVPSLSAKCAGSLRSFMTAENAMSILEAATKFDEKELVKSCLNFIKLNTRNAITSKDFDNISQTTLATLLKLDDMDASEVELFQAVLNWSDSQCSKNDMEPTRENKRSVIGDAIYHLRFLAMSQNEFAQNVATSGLLTAEEMIPIYNMFNGVQSPDLKWTISKKRFDRKKAIALSRKLNEIGNLISDTNIR